MALSHSKDRRKNTSKASSSREEEEEEEAEATVSKKSHHDRNERARKYFSLLAQQISARRKYLLNSTSDCKDNASFATWYEWNPQDDFRMTVGVKEDDLDAAVIRLSWYSIHQLSEKKRLGEEALLADEDTNKETYTSSSSDGDDDDLHSHIPKEIVQSDLFKSICKVKKRVELHYIGWRLKKKSGRWVSDLSSLAYPIEYKQFTNTRAIVRFVWNQIVKDTKKIDVDVVGLYNLKMQRFMAYTTESQENKGHIKNEADLISLGKKANQVSIPQALMYEF